jgi:hypothetical protein
MKTILLILTVLLLHFNSISQINLVLTGNCSTQGVYQINWADEEYWGGTGVQSWNTPNLLNPANSVTGDMVIVEGLDPVQHGNCLMDMACSSASAFTNLPDINGKIAIVRRGSCDFASKALAVQQAGAIACIIVSADNNPPIGMNGGSDGPSVFIPTIMVSSSAGIAICDAINQGCLQAYIGDPLLQTGYNSITGTVLYDVNNDNCASSTLNMLPYYSVVSSDGTNNYGSIIGINSPNQYTNYVGINTYTTTINGLPSYLDAVPNNDVITFSTYGNTHTANFCITPNQTINDVNISFINNSFFPGLSSVNSSIFFNNVGTNTQSGTITLNFDDIRFNFVSASEPVASQTTGQITFNYTNLQPYENRQINLIFDAEQPPVNNLGDGFTFNGQITPITGDVTPNDNIFSIQDTFVSSYDPNDIRVIEGNKVHIDNADEYLHYKIRFQNTGTAPAVNVIVNQTLDPNLNWSTLQIIDNSHPMSVSMVDDSVDFKFYNIYLPDSTSDEVGSHGYLTYKVKPISSVVLGDQISAKVDIYFDFNAPVITNTVTTTFVDYSNLTAYKENEIINLYPIPTTNLLNIKTDKNIGSIIIYNSLGRVVMSNKNLNQINLTTLQKGVYFCEIKDSEGHIITTQKVIKN